MAIFTKYVASLEATLEYDSMLATVTVIFDIEGKQIVSSLGKMTSQGLKLERYSEVSVTLKNVADRLWSKEHLAIAAKDREGNQAKKLRKKTSELLALRNAVNDDIPLTDANSLEIVEIKSSTNGNGKVKAVAK